MVSSMRVRGAESGVNCVFSALVEAVRRFYPVFSYQLDGGTHETDRARSSGYSRTSQHCRLRANRQGQGSPAGRDQGLAGQKDLVFPSSSLRERMAIGDGISGRFLSRLLQCC